LANRLSDQVHEALRAEILDGRLSPGDAVPSERALAERFGVNRHAVREALKRLQQASLVRISQGGATRVLDWRDSGGLEVLLDLAGDSGDVPPVELMRSVLEMRASIGVDAARRCAARAPAEDRWAIDALARAVIDSIEAGDGPHTDEAFATLWRAIVVGSGNIAYRLALNSLLTALDTYEPVAEALRPTDAEGLQALGASIAGGDVEAADAAARRLLEPDAATAL
jgi:DNA-binding FadR family transcriptional regulator